MQAPLNLMIRYGFTGYVPGQTNVLRVLQLLDKAPKPLNLLPYHVQNSASIPDVNGDFKKAFEESTKQEFTPENFRRFRLKNLERCDAFLVIRDTMSESTAFELGHLYAHRPNTPVFFAVHQSAEIKTTLIRELNENSVYYTFDEPDEVEAPLMKWLSELGQRDYCRN